MSQTFYMDLNGRVVCFDHLGVEAQAAFTRSPRSRRQGTSLTAWQRLSKRDILDIEVVVQRDYAIDKYAVVCEDCSYHARVGERDIKREAIR